MTTTSYSIAAPGFDNLTTAVVGADMLVPVRSGGAMRYRFLDNGASTPMLSCVADVVNDAMRWYSSVHRGSGFKSQLSTHAYEEARRVIERFVGMVRVSFGLYNTSDDVDALLKGVAAISQGQCGEYQVDDSNGDYLPVGFKPDLSEYFSYDVRT